MNWKQYKRKGLSEMRPYIQDEVLLKCVSISEADLKNGSPKVGDMIARNPKNHDDQWLVAEKYFNDNLELAPAPEETQDGATMKEWYGGFSKIERTEPVDEVSKLKEMVMDAARRGDEMAAHWKERAEKAEALVKQIHHYAGIIEGFQNK